MRGPVRAVVVVALLLSVAGMGTHYAVAADDHDRTRIGHEKLRNYDANVGERAYFWSTVVETASDGVRVSVAGSTVRVVGATPTVDRHLSTVDTGDVLQVYGRLGPDRVVTADRAIVSPESELVRMYAVSVLGGTLAIAFFLARWRVDRDRLVLVPRGDGDA